MINITLWFYVYSIIILLWFRTFPQSLSKLGRLLIIILQHNKCGDANSVYFIFSWHFWKLSIQCKLIINYIKLCIIVFSKWKRKTLLVKFWVWIVRAQNSSVGCLIKLCRPSMTSPSKQYELINDRSSAQATLWIYGDRPGRR